MIGTIVLHPARPEWGPGKVLEVLQGGKLVVYFRDLTEEKPNDAVKTISTLHVPLETAEDQSDPMLDHLPLFEKGRFKGQRKPRVGIQQAVSGYLERYPQGFADPRYLEDERNSKVAAHELWFQTLEDGQVRELLQAGDLEEVSRRVAAVEGKVNLLGVFEKSALSDALKDKDKAAEYFAALADVLGADEPCRQDFVRLVNAVQDLPQREGGPLAATWPVLTAYAFIARPDIHMLMKPDMAKSSAARLNFDLRYTAELSWKTYTRLLEMSRSLLEQLRPYEARDFIDVQSFMFFVAGI